MAAAGSSSNCLAASETEPHGAAAPEHRPRSCVTLSAAGTTRQPLGGSARFLAAVADAYLKAANLQSDARTASKMQEEALRQPSCTINPAAHLSEKARREGRPQDQQQWLEVAAGKPLIASSLQKG